MAIALFLFFDARSGKSSRRFSRETANCSPSPWGLEPFGRLFVEFATGEGPLRSARAGASKSLGRGEGGRLTIVCMPSYSQTGDVATISLNANGRACGLLRAVLLADREPSRARSMSQDRDDSRSPAASRH
jgi:hypothetical protein